MTKRLLLLAAFLVGSFNVANAQNLVTKKAQKVKDVQTEQSFNAPSTKTSVRKVSASDPLILTNYDYAGNNTIPTMLYMYDFDGDGSKDVVATAMQRSSVNTTRQVMGIVGNLADGFTAFPLHDAGAHGWGSVQVAEAGPLDGKALFMSHSGGATWFWQLDLTDFTVTGRDTAVLGGNFPGFAYLDDGTMFVTNANGFMYKSDDQLETLQDVGWLDPDVATDWPSEYYIKRSPNGQYLMHVAAWTYNGNGPIDSVLAEESDFVGINYSTDAGATWEFEIIGTDGVTEVANRPGYLPLFENFGQINGVVDNNGVMHVTANGYGFWLNGTDTTFAYPALYWNSRDRQWLAISDEAVETTLYADETTYDRPGNGFGNAYPVPAVSEDGSHVVVVWQGPEYAGTPGGDPNLYSGTNEIHYTDLYFVSSASGGSAFSPAQILVGAQETQESYPSLANPLREVDGKIFLDYMYMIDAIPGTSLFDDNNEASDESAWYYDEKELDFTVGVEGEETLVKDFQLEQNYPNPFNPSTTIKYNLPEAGMVTLKVYDVLGKEVATLVNQTQNQGAYQVNFDASNLSSGLYIYKISAGNFVSSKKMMLMK